MSERYSRIFSLSENLYAEGSPVLIKAGALLKDNDTSWLIAQLKLRNISNKVIKLVKVEITCFDSMQRPIDEAILYEYLDLNITRDVDFGTQNAIKVSNTSTRSYSVRVVEVGFADNTVWNGSDNIWEPTVEQCSIKSVITDEESLEGYKNTFGSNAVFSVCEHKDLWFCTCGATNRSNESHCYKCNAELAKLKNLDIDALKSEGIHIKEEKTKKTVKIKKIALTILIPLIIIGFLGLVGYFAIYPAILYATGNYRTYINVCNIKNFEIPEGKTSIGQFEFDSSNSLESITIPSSVTSIGYGAFRNCSSLKSVIIPNSITKIDSYAFYNCVNLESIVLPNSVTSIGDSAFWNCTRLKSITIPASLTTVGEATFGNCELLDNIYISDISAWCNTVFGESHLDSNPLYHGGDLYLNSKLVTELVIPNDVTSIGAWAFINASSLTSVIISDGVTSIGKFAFYDCTRLENITIPNSVQNIAKLAFYECTSLKNIYFGGTMEQWESIEKEQLWDTSTGKYTIYCTDGNISK